MADSLEEANKKKKIKNNNNNNPPPPQSGCGLHKIFPCVLPRVTRPFESEESYIDYLYILGFWFFGVAAIFVFVVMEYLMLRANIRDKYEIPIIVLVFLMAISLFVCFQIIFFGLITPFMIVSLIHYEFFYKVIFFFGFGDS